MYQYFIIMMYSVKFIHLYIYLHAKINKCYKMSSSLCFFSISAWKTRRMLLCCPCGVGTFLCPETKFVHNHIFTYTNIIKLEWEKGQLAFLLKNCLQNVTFINKTHLFHLNLLSDVTSFKYTFFWEVNINAKTFLFT